MTLMKNIDKAENIGTRKGSAPESKCREKNLLFDIEIEIRSSD